MRKARDLNSFLGAFGFEMAKEKIARPLSSESTSDLKKKPSCRRRGPDGSAAGAIAREIPSTCGSPSVSAAFRWVSLTHLCPGR